jgi:hypothetical protein
MSERFSSTHFQSPMLKIQYFYTASIDVEHEVHFRFCISHNFDHAIGLPEIYKARVRKMFYSYGSHKTS